MDNLQISHTCLRCKFSQWETRKADELGKTGKILRCTTNGGKVNPSAIMDCRYWRMGQTLADYFNGNLKGTHRQTISSILLSRQRAGTL